MPTNDANVDGGTVEGREDAGAFALDSRACLGCGDTAEDAGAFPTLGDGTSDRCEECAHSDGWNRCERCEEWSDSTCEVHGATSRRSSEEWCETCADSHAVACEECGETWTTERTVTVGRSEWCEECADEHSRACDHCGDRFDVRDGDYHSCDSCDALRCDGCGPCECSSTGAEPVSYRAADAGTVPNLPEGIRFGVEIECAQPCYPSDWESKPDGSLRGDSDLETVSPILAGTHGLARLYGAVRAMRRGGCDSCDNGGIHVHVSRAGAPYTVRDVFRILSHWAAWGEDLASYTVPAHRFDGYNECLAGAGKTRAADLAREIAEWAGPEDAPEWSRRYRNAGAPDFGDRSVFVNLYAIDAHGSIEFRLFDSIVDERTVTLWAATVARFVAFAVATDPARVAPAVERFGPGRFGLAVLSRGAGNVFAEWTRDLARGNDAPETHEAGRDPWGAARRASRATVRGTMLPFGRAVASDLAARDATAARRAEDAERAARRAERAESRDLATCAGGVAFRESETREGSGAGCVLSGACPFRHECPIVSLRTHAPDPYNAGTWGNLRADCQCYQCETTRRFRRDEVRRAVRDALRTSREVRDARSALACDVDAGRARAFVRLARGFTLPNPDGSRDVTRATLNRGPRLSRAEWYGATCYGAEPTPEMRATVERANRLRLNRRDLASYGPSDLRRPGAFVRDLASGASLYAD